MAIDEDVPIIDKGNDLTYFDVAASKGFWTLQNARLKMGTALLG
jgi:hypothetical protein